MQGKPDVVDDGQYDLDGCPYDGFNWSQEEYITEMQTHWKNQHYPVPATLVPHAIRQGIWFLNTLEQEKTERERRNKAIQNAHARKM